MRSFILLLLSLVCVSSISAQSYSTTFPATENPISEGGKWTNGGTTGLDWGNFATTVANKAHGTVSTVACGFNTGNCNDSTAIVTGVTWASNQVACAVVYLDPTLNRTGAFGFLELEIRLRSAISSHSSTGYELAYSIKNDGGQYVGAARWNGALNNFTSLTATSGGGVPPALSTGDTICGSAIGNVLTLSRIPVGSTVSTQLATYSDSTITTGSPGMGHFNQSSSLAASSLFGYSSFQASNANACPTGANYPSTNLATPAAFVTLAANGITSCWYIAANGSNASDGRTEFTPWQFSPGMNACNGNCSSAKAQPGVGFIHRGGDTWHFGDATTTPYAGIFPGCSGNGNNPTGLCLSSVVGNGTAANPIYYGVDKTWFTGGSWTRPILNADNPICNVNTLSGTCATYSSVGANGQGDGSNLTVQVTSCPFQVGSKNVFVDANNSVNRIFDNIELTGLCKDSTIPAKTNTFINYGSATNFWLMNLYLHGWTHAPYTFEPPNGGCNSATQVCYGIQGFGGSGPNGNGDRYRYVVMDGQDSDPLGAGADIAGYEDMAYSILRYQSQWIGNTHMHLNHDNIFEFFWDNGHTDIGMLSEQPTGVHGWYNDIWRHNFTFVAGAPGTGARGGVGVWMAHSTAAFPGAYTVYAFDILMYDTFGQSWDVGSDQGAISGHLIAFNSTLEKVTSNGIISCSTGTAGVSPVTFVNNHGITEGPIYAGNCAIQETALPLTDLVQTHTQATTAPNNYTASETFAFSPGAATWATVGSGTNETSSYCAAIATAASSDTTLTDMAAACQADTRYACVYNSTSHSMSCPARTVVARPVSATWDVGAYQFGGSAPAVTFNPTSVNFGVQAVGQASLPVTITLQNTGNANLTVTSFTLQTGTNFSIGANTCGSPVAPGNTCTVLITFTPTGTGTVTDNLSVADNVSGSPQLVLLAGSGATTAPAPIAFAALSK